MKPNISTYPKQPPKGTLFFLFVSFLVVEISIARRNMRENIMIYRARQRKSKKLPELCLPSRSLTASLPLKNDGWKTILSYWEGNFFRGHVKLREGIFLRHSDSTLEFLCFFCVYQVGVATLIADKTFRKGASTSSCFPTRLPNV